MSRIGIQPIAVPGGVKIDMSGNSLKVTGANGTLELNLHDQVELAVNGEQLDVKRKNDSREARAIHGLTRSLVSNMVTGVSSGFEKKLSIVGVGYKAESKGDTLVLNLGYSHQIDYKLPKGINAKVDKQTEISVTGADKQLVGQVAAEIRAFRKPEPYKGKGIRYVDEIVRRKAGKAGKAGA